MGPRKARQGVEGQSMRLRAKKGHRRRLALWLDQDVARALRVKALEQDTSASAIVEHLVRSWLAAQQKRKERAVAREVFR